ncbi:MAG: DUF3137 domain-containing protein [Candidatus Omnitrophica bacterium]|nr:DUF3137 domain-containing protein [Candidatus Omnitrophota bacterium]MDD5488730.1 DUF3137 domain-containing protein [Candidatus Omnitrophota bacterium]
MKTIGEVEGFYYTTLLNDLVGLEKERIKVARKAAIVGLILAVAVVVLEALCLKEVLSEGEPVDPRAFIAFPLVASVLWGAWLKLVLSKYVCRFKHLVIERLIHFVEPDLSYHKNRHINRDIFCQSGLFTTAPDRYEGDDLVEGRIGLTKVRFSEVHAESKTRNRRGGTEYNTIFKGMFFVGDFNKHFKGRTFVLPDTAERVLGHIGTFLQSIPRGRGKLARMEDPEFEKEFVVYCEDDIEARYILSTSLMKRIVEYRKKTGKEMRISFVDDKIFIGISYARGLFEPRLFRTILEFAPVKEYYEDLRAAIDIVEDLNLDLRIWTK